MEAEEKARVMEEFYSNFIEETLRAAFQNGDKTKIQYNSASARRREEIDVEIRRQAREVGRTIAKRLIEAEFSKKDPPQEALERIIRETLSEHSKQ
jgi:hypothetical protein